MVVVVLMMSLLYLMRSFENLSILIVCLTQNYYTCCCWCERQGDLLKYLFALEFTKHFL